LEKSARLYLKNAGAMRKLTAAKALAAFGGKAAEGEDIHVNL
jgi:hypothetical protein